MPKQILLAEVYLEFIATSLFYYFVKFSKVLKWKYLGLMVKFRKKIELKEDIKECLLCAKCKKNKIKYQFHCFQVKPSTFYMEASSNSIFRLNSNLMY